MQASFVTRKMLLCISQVMMEKKSRRPFGRINKTPPRCPSINKNCVIGIHQSWLPQRSKWAHSDCGTEWRQESRALVNRLVRGRFIQSLDGLIMKSLSWWGDGGMMVEADMCMPLSEEGSTLTSGQRFLYILSPSE